MKLKPCPFCGGKAEVMEKTDDDHVWCKIVSCYSCWAKTGLFDKREDAIKAWNTRPKLSEEKVYGVILKKVKEQEEKYRYTLDKWNIDQSREIAKAICNSEDIYE
ncbi:MAG: Lar family restriction alleviation protein [Nanoarchaeota archaeon]|nr:Lar family restriction alleviation protein [Nanoarchaeota archaeon]